MRIDTVRYYERSGLLVPRPRLACGFGHGTRLKFRVYASFVAPKHSGLRKVRELLALSMQRDVAGVKRRAQTKLTDVNGRIAALQRIRDGLSTLIEACPGRGPRIVRS